MNYSKVYLLNELRFVARKKEKFKRFFQEIFLFEFEEKLTNLLNFHFKNSLSIFKV